MFVFDVDLLNINSLASLFKLSVNSLTKHIQADKWCAALNVNLMCIDVYKSQCSSMNSLIKCNGFAPLKRAISSPC